MVGLNRSCAMKKTTTHSTELQPAFFQRGTYYSKHLTFKVKKTNRRYNDLQRRISGQYLYYQLVNKLF